MPSHLPALRQVRDSGVIEADMISGIEKDRNWLKYVRTSRRYDRSPRGPNGCCRHGIDPRIVARMIAAITHTSNSGLTQERAHGFTLRLGTMGHP